MKTIAGTMTVEAGAKANPATTVGRAVALVKSLPWRLQRQRTRLALGDLTDDQLRDIGLTRAQAEREALKSPFSD